MTFTVHSLPRPELAVDRRTRAGRLKMFGVLAVCALPVAASYFTYFVVRPEMRSNYGELIDPPRPVPPALPLSALDGTAVDPASLSGQWLLVVVAGGGCDEACERTLHMQRQLHAMLGRERARVDKVWLVDDASPPSQRLLDAVQAAPEVTVLRTRRDALARWLSPSNGRDLHAHLYIVDPHGAWMMRAPADPDPQRVKRDLDRLLRASASWDRAGR